MNTWRILHGDVRERLRDLPDGSVQTCVTSPPYWGLRDYGTAKWDGGNGVCDHRAPDDAGATQKPSKGQREHAGRFAGPSCWRCGARRIDNQIGLEPTPDAFVASLVEVFREVRRVLAEDGTAWVNLGDSYAGGGGYAPNAPCNQRRSEGESWGAMHAFSRREAEARTKAQPGYVPNGLKPKDLVGIPWRVAFALQADGWYLRSDIIWSKPNPMPESVTDRPTKAHEYIFLLSKSARYYYDAEAIKEQSVDMAGWQSRMKYKLSGRPEGATVCPGDSEGQRYAPKGMRAVPDDDAGRNKRSVWHIATQPYPEAHFATFPEALIEPCILAGTSEKGCCPKCYKGWVRVVDVDNPYATEDYRNRAHKPKDINCGGLAGRGTPTSGLSKAGWRKDGPKTSRTMGWQPSCDCQAGDPIPCTVLDPFNGSGTTGAVAIRHQRNYIGIELNAEYVRLSEARIGAVAPLFAQQSHTEPEPEEISLFTMEETA